MNCASSGVSIAAPCATRIRSFLMARSFSLAALGALGSLLDRLAGVVAPQPALRRAGVEAEDVGLRLLDEAQAVVLVERQADRHHVHLASELQHARSRAAA
jgi:hypothetical protein